jgi:hypothetical protein
MSWGLYAKGHALHSKGHIPRLEAQIKACVPRVGIDCARIEQTHVVHPMTNFEQGRFSKLEPYAQRHLPFTVKFIEVRI